MALLWLEGFEAYADSSAAVNIATKLRERYSYADSNFATNSGRFGTGISAGTSTSISTGLVTPALNTIVNEIYVGFAWYPSQDGAATTQVIQFYGMEDLGAVSTPQIFIAGVTYDALNDHFVLTGPSSNLPQQTVNRGTFISSWNYIEARIVVSNTVGEFELRVNGQTVMEYYNVDTLSGTTGELLVRFIEFGGSGSIGWFDDIYILDGSGNVNNNFLGDIEVKCIFPDANGSVNEWSPDSGSNFDRVNETDGSDDDTSYVSNNVGGKKELYSFDTLSGFNRILGTQNVIVGKKVDTGFKNLKTLVKSGSTEVAGTHNFYVPSEYCSFSDCFDLDPNGNIEWTVAAINAAEFGFQDLGFLFNPTDGIYIDGNALVTCVGCT